MTLPAVDARRMTYAEYVELVRRSERKYEYVNGEAYAMAGGSPEHARLQSRLAHLLSRALGDRRCEPFSSDLRVRIEDTGRATYPDVTVVCDHLERARDDEEAVVNPTLIVEVLSDSTEASDRGEKWAHYQRIPSLRHYVLVSQDSPRIEVFTREPQGWHYDDRRAGESITLSALEITLSVDEIYERRL